MTLRDYCWRLGSWRFRLPIIAYVMLASRTAWAASYTALPLIDTPLKAKEAQAQAAVNLGQPAEWTNSVGMKFRLIPAGEFIMGSNGPAAQSDVAPHHVRITRPFYMATTAVTRQQWEVVTKTVRSDFFPGPDQPMNYIAWEQADEFVCRLSKLESKPYRLPTEAQWEYAARAGVTTDYPTGDTAKDLDQFAWYDQNSGAATHPVAQKAANAWGLFDMLGNTWQWCDDFYAPDFYHYGPMVDPTGPKLPQITSYRVLRGGSALYGAKAASFSHRDYSEESRGSNNTGFRVVLPVDTKAP